MRILTLLLSLALLNLTGCAANSSRPSPAPWTPINCDAATRLPCEPPLIDPPGALLGDTEATDAANRARWQRCALRHAAAVRCLRALEAAGFLRE